MNKRLSLFFKAEYSLLENNLNIHLEVKHILLFKIVFFVRNYFCLKNIKTRIEK
jgi:hypothetical protein